MIKLMSKSQVFTYETEEFVITLKFDADNRLFEVEWFKDSESHGKWGDWIPADELPAEVDADLKVITLEGERSSVEIGINPDNRDEDLFANGYILENLNDDLYKTYRRVPGLIPN